MARVGSWAESGFFGLKVVRTLSFVDESRLTASSCNSEGSVRIVGARSSRLRDSLVSLLTDCETFFVLLHRSLSLIVSAWAINLALCLCEVVWPL